MRITCISPAASRDASATKASDKNLGKSGSLIDRVSAPTNYGETASDEATNPTLGAAKDGAPEEAVNEADSKDADKYDAINRVINEANAAAPCPNVGYAEYREITALNPAAQRVINMYFEQPMDR